MPVFSTATLGPVTLRNRLIKAATFEGLAKDNKVTDRLVEFHRSFAAGGVGMTTVAYMAISDSGRGAPGEVVLTSDALPGLRSLVEAVHGEGAAVAAQVGHAGPVAAGTGHPGLAPSRVFSPMAMKFTKPASDDDLARVITDFGRAAAVVAEAGFDAVEIHMGHGYLISSFLSPRLNRRTDRWGGALANRAALAREVARTVRETVGRRIAVTAKLNMTDGVPGGLWLDESVEVARLLEADGHLDALELTGGSSFQNPMYLLRGEVPLAEMGASFKQPIRTGFKVAGKRFLVAYPFEEAYFLDYARQFRAALSMPLILLGGVNRLTTASRAIEEGFDFVAMGRALLRDPSLPSQWQRGEVDEGLCVHCNKCIPTIYRGTHCVLVPPEERPGRQ